MNIIQKATISLLFVNMVVIVIAAYMLFWPTQLPIIYNEPFPVTPNVVKKGGTISYTMEVNKRKAYGVNVSKNIICNDGNLVTLASVVTNIPLGRSKVTPEVVIPQKTSLGTCHIVTTSEYRINPLRTETQHMSTQDFIVIP